MATEGNIPIQNPDTTHQRLDATSHTNGSAQTVLREAVNITDGDTFAARAKVTNAAPSSSDYGLVTRVVGTVAEDAAASSGDAGFPMLAVRRDSAASSSGTDGDYSTVNTDSSGRIWVNASGAAVPVTDNGGNISIDDGGNSITVDGTVAVSGSVAVTLASGATAIAKAEDVASADADVGVPAMAVRKATPANTSGTDGDYEMLQMSAGRLWVDASGVTLTVGSHAVTNAGTFAVQATVAAGATNIAKAEDDASANADVGVPAMAVRKATPANTSGTDGDYEMLQMAAGRLWVDASGVTLTVGSHAVTNAGTFAVQADSVIPGTGATNLGKAEDAAHSSGDTGVMSLAVRRDANTTLVGTDGDYAPLQVDSSGSLKVAIISGAGSGGTSATDDAAFSVASGSGTPIMGLADETSPDSVDEGDVGVVRMTLTRALHVNLRDSSGTELAVGGGTQYTEDAAATANPIGNALIMVRDDARGGSLTSADGDNIAARGTNSGELYVKHLDQISVAGIAGTITPGTGANDLGKAEDAAHTSGDTGVFALAVRKDTATQLAGTDGDYSPIITDASGRLHVNVGNTVTVGSHAVTNAGTFAVQADSVIPGSGATNLGKAEDAAHASGDVGVMALSVRQNTATATSGTDGDYQPLITDTNGRLHVLDANSASALTALQLIDDPVVADDAGFTAGTTKVMMAGWVADESSTDSVNEDDAGAARMTLDRKVITTLYPHTSGGLSTFMASGSDGSSILVATAQAVKASAGQLYGYYAYNPEAAVSFVHFYNTAAASVTVGTTNPLFTLAIPAGSAANLTVPQGITFSNAGWSVAATTTAGGNTSPATGVSLVAWYI